MKKLYYIKRTLLTHYYKLDWSTDYGKTKEKVYLAIKGIIKPHPNLYLDVRNIGFLWHEAGGKDKIEKISKLEFKKNATGNNVARFYSTMPQYNELLNYSPEIWEQLKKYNIGDEYGRSYRKTKKLVNKKSVRDELKVIDDLFMDLDKEKNKRMEERNFYGKNKER